MKSNCLIGSVKKVIDGKYKLQTKDGDFYFQSDERYADGERIGVKGKIVEDRNWINRFNIVEIESEMDELSFISMHSYDFGADIKVDRDKLNKRLTESDDDDFMSLVNQW